MVIGKISDALFPGATSSEGGDGNTTPPTLTPELGAAGLMVEASQRDGAYTEVERQGVASALMKMFHLPGPKAAALRAQAEALQAESTTVMGFAAAAAQLPGDDRDQLVAALWSLTQSDGSVAPMEQQVMGTVAEAFGLSRERLGALRPR